jgi:hypothetical protein
MASTDSRQTHCQRRGKAGAGERGCEELFMAVCERLIERIEKRSDFDKSDDMV